MSKSKAARHASQVIKKAGSEPTQVVKAPSFSIKKVNGDSSTQRGTINTIKSSHKQQKGNETKVARMLESQNSKPITKHEIRSLMASLEKPKEERTDSDLMIIM